MEIKKDIGTISKKSRVAMRRNKKLNVILVWNKLISILNLIK